MLWRIVLTVLPLVLAIFFGYMIFEFPRKWHIMWWCAMAPAILGLIGGLLWGILSNTIWMGILLGVVYAAVTTSLAFVGACIKLTEDLWVGNQNEWDGY